MSEDLTKKERPWLLPELPAKKMVAGLYLVATPIGNLRDISIRALDTLAGADVIACEDTRVTRKLLSHFGLKKKLLSYNDHNADAQRSGVLEAVAHGEIVALVSDAGMPLISDPGYKLARDALDLGLYVSVVPGANAPLSALQLSGLPSDRFSFVGFLPPKAGAREKLLKAWEEVQGSLIAFETGPRLLAALESIEQVYGDRPVAVVREITKLYEESRRGGVSELIAHYASEGAPKGEIVLVIGAGTKEFSDADIDELLQQALADMSTKDAAAAVAEKTGLQKKDLYNRALKVSEGE